MSEKDITTIGAISQEIIFALEERLNERFPEQKVYFTTSDFKLANQILLRHLTNKEVLNER